LSSFPPDLLSFAPSRSGRAASILLAPLTGLTSRREAISTPVRALGIDTTRVARL
jgi:hypothetical protein